MEYTSDSFKKVHIVQPAFLASDLLSADIEKFIKAGASSPRLLFLGSKRIVIDHENYFNPDFKRKLADANQRFSDNVEQLPLRSRVSMQFLGKSALRFQIIPSRQDRFKEAMHEIEDLPGVIEEELSPEGYFLQATLPQSILADEEKMREAAKTLRRRMVNENEDDKEDEGGKSLYSVRPYQLVDKIAEVALLKIPE